MSSMTSSTWNAVLSSAVLPPVRGPAASARAWNATDASTGRDPNVLTGTCISIQLLSPIWHSDCASRHSAASGHEHPSCGDAVVLTVTNTSAERGNVRSTCMANASISWFVILSGLDVRTTANLPFGLTSAATLPLASLASRLVNLVYGSLTVQALVVVPPPRNTSSARSAPEGPCGLVEGICA